MNTPQYFQMWDVALLDAPPGRAGQADRWSVVRVHAQRRASQWTAFFAHVKAANTVPDWVSNHNEGEGGVPQGVDDPVVVGQSIRDAMTAAGIDQRPLSSNEYQGAGHQTADNTAWYVNRLAQSSYTTAMRGNWNCCMVPNMTGLLSNAQTGWAPTGNWWAEKTGADMTGSLVQTSNEVDTMSISAAKDDSKQQAVALLGDINAFTGSANVKFTGLDSTPYLVKNGMVHATVYGIPEGVLYAPVVQFSGDLPVAEDGSVTVPANFVGTHDAASIYLSWTDPQTVTIAAPAALVPGQSYDVPVTITNRSGTAGVPGRDLARHHRERPDQDGGNHHHLHGRWRDLSHGQPAGARGVDDGNVPRRPPGIRPDDGLPPGRDRQPGAERRTATVSNSVDIVSTCVTEMNCEAEDGTFAGGACYKAEPHRLHGQRLRGLLRHHASGRGVTQKFSVASAGTYTLDLRYSAGHDGPAANANRTATLTANGSSQQISLPPTTNWNTWAVSTVTVQLAAGTNTVSIVKNAGDNGWFNLDHLVLHAPVPPGPQVVVTAATRCVAGKVVVTVTATQPGPGVRDGDDGDPVRHRLLRVDGCWLERQQGADHQAGQHSREHGDHHRDRDRYQHHPDPGRSDHLQLTWASAGGGPRPDSQVTGHREPDRTGHDGRPRYVAAVTPSTEWRTR